MRKSFALLLIFFIFLMCSPMCKGNFGVNPRELSIIMNDEFVQGNTSKSVMITNNIQESINISWYLDHPTSDLIRENKTLIPSLSWINLEPKWQIIPPESNAFFYIYLDIPEEQENFNQHWEAWPVFKQEEIQFFNWEHTVRLYIDTPENFLTDNNKEQDLVSFITENPVIIAVIAIVCIAFAISLFIIIPKIKKNKKS